MSDTFYQLNLFDYDIENIRYCKNCENYKFKERILENDFGWCNIARTYVTDYSYDWLCAKNHNEISQYCRRKIGGVHT